MSRNEVQQVVTPDEKPAEVEPTAPKRKRLTRADVEERRARKRTVVYLPERDAEVELQELRPVDMSVISDKCQIRRPHSDPAMAAIGMKEIDFDGKRRAAYIIAKALLNERGVPMYMGDDYIWGAELIQSEFSNAEQDLLYKEATKLSGIDKEGREAAGKGSAPTPNGGPSAPSPSTT